MKNNAFHATGFKLLIAATLGTAAVLSVSEGLSASEYKQTYAQLEEQCLAGASEFKAADDGRFVVTASKKKLADCGI